MQLSIKESRTCLLNSRTRIPFRYGAACLTHCPQAILEVTIEAKGKLWRGYAGDCLPPGWFDKSPGKDFSQQVDDMIAVMKLAEKTYAEEFASRVDFFSAWLIAYERIHSRAAEWGFTPLLASFGASLTERAVLDALARAAGMSFHQAVWNNIYNIIPADVHPELVSFAPRDVIAQSPADSIYVRHTVGLGDPLTAADIPAAERLDDGFPQSLEEYIQQTGLRYFKIKVSNQLDHDIHRLVNIAGLIEATRADDYAATLDGNEQYHHASEFDDLVQAIESNPSLQTFWRNTLLVEQPLSRAVALDANHTAGVKALSGRKPVIIDESDGTLDSYKQAVELGYRGVSSKSCKGPVKSILNAALTKHFNETSPHGRFVITGEDLCCVGIVPVQADLCLAAALGLTHTERNGHHFHPGISYLPAWQQEAALLAHPDFYEKRNNRIAPKLRDGKFNIASLQCAGFGVDVTPDMNAMTSIDEWRFESLFES